MKPAPWVPAVPEDEDDSDALPEHLFISSGSDGGNCGFCGGRLLRSLGGSENVCQKCGGAVEGDLTLDPDDHVGTSSDTPQVQIVGTGSRLLQPDLYRSGPGTSADAVRRAAEIEIDWYCDAYERNNNTNFTIPHPVRQLAAAYFIKLQAGGTHRCNSRRQILAVCTQLASEDNGFAPARPSVFNEIFQLPSLGNATGVGRLRQLEMSGVVKCKRKDTGVSIADRGRLAMISTMLSRLGFSGEKHEILQKVTLEVIQTADENTVGVRSKPVSKTTGALFYVLKNCSDRSVVATEPELQGFCTALEQVKYTISLFVNELNKHSQLFQPVLRKHGL